MTALIDLAASKLESDIPKEAAHQVIANQVISNVLAAGPLAFKILSKWQNLLERHRPSLRTLRDLSLTEEQKVAHS